MSTKENFVEKLQRQSRKKTREIERRKVRKTNRKVDFFQHFAFAI